MSNEQRSELEHLIHDARKPLNQISMQAELVKLMAAEPASSGKVQEAADKIIAASKSCSALLQTILEQGKNE
ncbi:histidine kinase dimerization/phospho-acceptor domain-containing protein [Pseudoalteromonas 'SMAR']|uniref:histidine kinase dimerization/phospho-acceptor domain-containing protein n=1 Tax=Pseudoalteromonas 'SMAR' TaxID=3416908 RepID=UPI003AF270D2